MGSASSRLVHKWPSADLMLPVRHVFSASDRTAHGVVSIPVCRLARCSGDGLGSELTVGEAADP